jgi:pyruvate dehydrogenase E2 component (dihydrolipoamide acetyltransferase)
MSVEIKLPELGENIESAQVTSVLVQKGDQVEKDQIILEIETDKAVVEVPSEIAGKVEEVMVAEGDKVNIGATLIKIIAGDTTVEEVAKEAVKEEEAPVKEEVKEVEKFPENKKTGEKKTIDLQIPDLGEGIEKADITQVFVEVGDEVKIDQALLEMETDKATLELPCEYNGKVVALFVKAGEQAEVGKVFLQLETTDYQRMEEVPALEQDKQKQVAEEVTKNESAPVVQASSSQPTAKPAKSNLFNMPGKIAPAAPTIRRFARQIGVDINEVPGSGPGGRISMDDVKAYSKALHTQYKEGGMPGSGIHIEKEALPDFSKFGNVRVEDMSNVRRKTAEHLSYAWATVPMVTQFDKADITGLETTRKKFSKMTEKESGNKLTITAILLKVVALALKKFPQFNASIDMENKQIIYKDYFNVGVAVDTERGLIVPVLRNVDQKSIFEISDELAEIAMKARNRKIGLDDLQGGNFTISNLGGLGGTSFTPIVNSPEVAILGVSRGGFEPRYENGEFVPRLMLPLSLTYDHRIIDGADAVRFIRWISTALEEPLMIAMNN